MIKEISINEITARDKLEIRMKGYPDIIFDYLKHLINNGKTFMTARQHIYNILQLVDYMDAKNEELFFTDVDSENIHQYIRFLLRQKNKNEEWRVSDKTLHLKYNAISIFFNWLTENNKIDTNPMAEIKCPNRSDYPENISIRMLVAYPRKYENEYVSIIDSLIIASNDIPRRTLRVYEMIGTYGYKNYCDYDCGIDIYYGNIIDKDKFIMLNANNQEIKVIGKVRREGYKYYISAREINLF